MLLAGVVLYYAPRFLAYSDNPIKADAIILFCGDEKREPEAKMLLNKSYARYLIIPAYGEIWQSRAGGGIERISPDSVAGKLISKLQNGTFFKKHYEKTHVEVLYGKMVMDELGLHSVMLVSSPYHMRRIRFIAEKVFDDKEYSFYCIPTPAERSYTTVDWLYEYSRDTIIREYVKLGWFLLYENFS